MAEIRSKREFFRLWESGALGNRTRLFYTLEALHASGIRGKVGFRELGRAGGGAWELAPSIEHVPEIYARWKASGKSFVMDDAFDNTRTTMQGELCRTYRGLQGFIAVGRGLPPMRRSIAEGLHRHCSPLETRTLMRRFMDPSSQDDVDDLLDRYPDATVEFACCDVNVGIIPGRNTMIWEVRNY